MIHRDPNETEAHSASPGAPSPWVAHGPTEELDLGGLDLDPEVLGPAWSRGTIQWQAPDGWATIPELGLGRLGLKGRGRLGLVVRALGQRVALRTLQAPDESVEVQMGLLALEPQELQAIRATLSAGISAGGPTGVQSSRVARAAQGWEALHQGLNGQGAWALGPSPAAPGEAPPQGAALTRHLEALCVRLGAALEATVRALHQQELALRAEVHQAQALGHAPGGVVCRNWQQAAEGMAALGARLRGLPDLRMGPALAAQAALEGGAAWRQEAEETLQLLERLGGLRGQADPSGPARQQLYEGLMAAETLRELARLGFAPAAWNPAWATLWNGDALQPGEIELTHQGVGGLWSGHEGDHPAPAAAQPAPLRLRVRTEEHHSLGMGLRVSLIPEAGEGPQAALREEGHHRQRQKRAERVTAWGGSISPHLMDLVIGARLDGLAHPEELAAIHSAARLVRQSGHAQSSPRPPMVACLIPGVMGRDLAQWSAAPVPSYLLPEDAPWRISTLALKPGPSPQRDRWGLRRLLLAWLTENRIVWLCPQCGEDLDRHEPSALVSREEGRKGGEDLGIGLQDGIPQATRIPVRQKAHLVCPCCGGYAFVSFCAQVKCQEDHTESGTHPFYNRTMIIKFYASAAAFASRGQLSERSEAGQAWLKLQINASRPGKSGKIDPNPPCPRCGDLVTTAEAAPGRGEAAKAALAADARPARSGAHPSPRQPRKNS